MCVIYETQKDSKIASTCDLPSLTFANEDSEFCEYVTAIGMEPRTT